MLLPGMTSVTFRNRTAQDVVNLTLEAGLNGIEWGGDIHVPVTEIDKAVQIAALTWNSGLNVSAYGSYYTVGKSKDEGMHFAEVLQIAEILDAPLIRIWAGDTGSKEATAAYRKGVVEETKEIADEAGMKEIGLAFEFHENTLNDTYESCYELLNEIAHPIVNTYWQPLHGAGPKINGSGIDMILPWIVGVHVFHWWPKAEVRLTLQQGLTHWKKYFDKLSSIPKTVFANIEFVKDNATEHFFDDAKTLLDLTRYHQIEKGEDKRWCLKQGN